MVVIEVYYKGKLIKTKRTSSEHIADDYVAMCEERGYSVKQWVENK